MSQINSPIHHDPSVSNLEHGVVAYPASDGLVQDVEFAKSIQGADAETSTGSASIDIPAGSYVTREGQIMTPVTQGTTTLPPPSDAYELVNGGTFTARGCIIDNSVGTTVFDPVHGLLPDGARNAEGMILLADGQTLISAASGIESQSIGATLLGPHDYDVGGYLLMANGNKLIKTDSWIDGTGDIRSNQLLADPMPSWVPNEGYVQLTDGGILRGDVLHTRVGSMLLSGVNSNDQANLEAMVQSTYRSTLGREGEPGGVAHWLTAAQHLRAEGASDASIQSYLSEQFKNSDEYLVRSVYRSTLNREGESAGVSGWVNVVRDLRAEGQPPETIRTWLVDQFEMSVEGTVKSVYWEVLGREGDAEGVANWIAAARSLEARGDTASDIRAHLVEQFMASEEYLNRAASAGLVSAASVTSASGDSSSQPADDEPIPPLPDPGSSVTESEQLKLTLMAKIGRFIDLNGSTTVAHHEDGTVDVTFDGSVGGGRAWQFLNEKGEPSTDIDNNAFEAGANVNGQTTVHMNADQFDEFVDSFNIAQEEQGPDAILMNSAETTVEDLNTQNGGFLTNLIRDIASVSMHQSEAERSVGQGLIELLPGTSQANDAAIGTGIAEDMNLPTTFELGAGISVTYHVGVDTTTGPGGAPLFNFAFENNGEAGAGGSVRFNPDGSYEVTETAQWNVNYDFSTGLNTSAPHFLAPHPNVELSAGGGSTHSFTHIHDSSGQIIGLEVKHTYDGQFVRQKDAGTNTSQSAQQIGALVNGEWQSIDGRRTEVVHRVAVPSGMTVQEAFTLATQNPDNVTWRTEVTVIETTAESTTTQAGWRSKNGNGATGAYTTTQTYETIVDTDYSTDGGFSPEHVWLDGDMTVDANSDQTSDRDDTTDTDHHSHNSRTTPDTHESVVDMTDTTDDGFDSQNLWGDGDLTVDTTAAPVAGNDVATESNYDPENLWGDGDLTVDTTAAPVADNNVATESNYDPENLWGDGDLTVDTTVAPVADNNVATESNYDPENLWGDGDLTVDTEVPGVAISDSTDEDNDVDDEDEEEARRRANIPV